MIKLFTSTTCGFCRDLKEELDKKDIKYKEFSINDSEGLGEYYFYFHNASGSIPALVDQEDDGIIMSTYGLENVREYLKNKEGGNW